MDFKNHFFYENNFYLTAPVNRISKFITHLDLFRKISNLRGEIIECGVFKGNSLMRWIKFRALIEIVSLEKFMPLIHLVSFQTLYERRRR